jgi:triosephosphate isomerase
MRGLREGDLELILASLTGDQWERLQELLGGVGHKAMPKLTEDLMDHFDLYEPVTLIGAGGGKVTRKRPTEIQALLNQGYRPVGEAASRT